LAARSELEPKEAEMAVGSEHDMLRAARNQSLYRQVNEKIEGLNEAFGEVLDAGSSWVCECADRECTETMQLTLAEYRRLRAHPNRFAVLPGHVYEDVEVVVETHRQYVVVEKLGTGATYSITHDPRDRASA
jgi:hypothetical protein